MVLQSVLIVVLVVLILKSKVFKVWHKGYNKTKLQKRAIRFLVYGPSRSKMTAEDYDSLCKEMYPDQVLFQKACVKLNISDSDLISHPLDMIASRYLLVQNYVKEEGKVLFTELGNGRFRSSKVVSIMMLFGKQKLYLYQISFRTDLTLESEASYEYEYGNIVSLLIDKHDDSIHASISVLTNQGEEATQSEHYFPVMLFNEEQYKKWEAVAKNLDSQYLRDLLAGKNEDEQKALRYFNAYCHLPVAISDVEYDSMVEKCLPQDKLRKQAIDEMDIPESDMIWSEPIDFRSYSYVFDQQRVFAVKGKDDLWRSSEPQYTCLFFGKSQMYIYCVSMDLTSSSKRTSTYELFYKDISMKTIQDSKDLVIGQEKYTLSYYTLTIIMQGDMLSLNIPILSDENDRKIRALRNLLRSQKQTSASAFLTNEDIA